MMNRKYNTELFISEAKKVHNNKYDYSKVNYINGRTKVTIICSKHGEFWQEPRHHLKGCNCPKCSNVHKPSNEEFIEKARKIHGGKYDYSKVEYKKAIEKVCVICPIHGEFWITPNAHLNGHGCGMCNKGGVKPFYETFVERAKNIHGDKWIYDKANYVNSKTKVCIICPKHGEFWQTPDKHLQGRGCPICSGKMKKTTEQFISECKTLYGDLYDYTKVKYVNKNTKIVIKCNKCGNEFEMTPHNHLIHGEGCPHCKMPKMEKEVARILDINGIEYEKQKVFDWLVDGKSIKKFDFYLPKYNVVIECQGLQHFKSIEWFGGEKHYIIQKSNDELKRKLCEEHGIKVLYYSNLNIDYPYEVITDKEKLIEAINSNE